MSDLVLAANVTSFRLIDDGGRQHGFWVQALRRLARNRLALLAALTIAGIALLALLAPVIAPVDPSLQDFSAVFASPSLHHIAGTDNLGRDWFSRLLYGARLSLAVGVFTQAIVLAIGLPLGLLAGCCGRWWDTADRKSVV